MFKIFFGIFILLACHEDMAHGRLKETIVLTSKILEIRNEISNTNRTQGKPSNFTLRNFISKINVTADRIEAFELSCDGNLTKVVNMLHSELNFFGKISGFSSEIIISAKKIGSLYKKILLLSRKVHTADFKNFTRFARNNCYRENHPSKFLNDLYRIFTDEETDFMTEIQKSMKLKELDICDTHSSLKLQLYRLYNAIMLTEIQGLATVAFSYAWLSLRTKGTYGKNLMVMKTEQDVRLAEYSNIFRHAIKHSENSIRRCDPQGKHQFGITYAELSGFIQAFIMNQLDYEQHLGGDCRSGCESIKYSPRDCWDKRFCGSGYRKSCDGIVFNCRGGGSYDICETVGDSSRNYHWFKFTEDGTVYGDSKEGCKNGKMTHAHSWRRFFFSCDYCVCLCDNSHVDRYSQKIRAISYIWSSTNSSANMVAIGARIVAKDRMIQLQIQEGKLLPYGKIDQDSVRWVPLPKFAYDRGFPSEIIFANGSKRHLEEGVDFSYINVTDNKIFLNNAIADPNHVLTGARFYDYQLDISYMGLDFEKGKLTSPSTPVIHSEKEPIVARRFWKELELIRPDNPLKLTRTVPDFQPNQFVQIWTSDMKKDGSQSTVPFFDLLDVVTTPSFPLSGIALFHKGSEDRSSGGFFSLRIFPFDIEFLT